MYSSVHWKCLFVAYYTPGHSHALMHKEGAILLSVHWSPSLHPTCDFHTTGASSVAKSGCNEAPPWPRTRPSEHLWPRQGTQEMMKNFSSGTSGEDFQVNQPQSLVSVSAGDVTTVACNMPALSPAGHTLWYKKTGTEWQLIFNSFNRRHFPWVAQVGKAMANQTDYSICTCDWHPDMECTSGPWVVSTVW